MNPTSKQMVAAFERYLREKRGYVWGLNGELYTKEMAAEKKRKRAKTSKYRDPETYWTEDCARWFGIVCADCSGGIVSAVREVNPKYGDRSAATFKAEFTEGGKIDTLPEIPGVALWYSGHIGLYVGNGEAIEFRGTEYGCVRTKVKGRGWTHWGKIKGVNYSDATEAAPKPDKTAWVVKRVLKLPETPNTVLMRGEDVRELQRRLINAGFVRVVVEEINKSLIADGTYGKVTAAAVKLYQRTKKLDIDGKAGKQTVTALGGVWED